MTEALGWAGLSAEQLAVTGLGAQGLRTSDAMFKIPRLM